MDQSDATDSELEELASSSGRLTVIEDKGRGLSRARNIAWRALRARWIIFLDDDCITAPDWAAAFAEQLTAHDDVAFASGHVGPGGTPGGAYLPVTTFPVDRQEVRAGRWTRPHWIGFGVCMAVKRTVIERLGGWDERLGPGAPDFPAADDVDFNYRLLRAGERALATPAPRAFHEQWRRADELPTLWKGYMSAWAGFAVKHLRTGDVKGGAWLWGVGVAETARMLASAFRRRSRLRLSVGLARARGLAAGTAKAAFRSW